MAKLTVPLTSTKIEASKPKDNDYSLFDGKGLILLIRTTGTKTWRYRYKNTSGTQILTLGTYPALNLKQARNLRVEFESMLANGQDPKEQKALKEAKANNAHSLENVTRSWLDGYAIKKPLDADTKHKRLRKFENHLFPKFKARAIDQIQLRELKDALNAIYEKSPDNAQRIRADLVLIFGYAKQHSWLEVNIARELDDMDLSADTKHRATLKDLDRIPQLIKRIKADTGHPITKLCLLLALHTSARSSEIRFARWSEIDFDKKEWVIPAQRELANDVKHSDRGAKMKIAHLVPLSNQVIQLFKELHQYTGNGDFVLPSPRNPNIFLSENAPNQALQRMGYAKDELSLHGFRALARSALGEMSIFSKEALEKQMSHKEKNAVVDAYTHIAEYLEERQKIMDVWSNWLDLIESSEYVTPFRYGKSIKNSLSI
ncbi:tyrosine-type recombinase/integrase [Acinetobacter junii]|uniref:integrase arm-type DNA-binding domain-containing protein n=1 Tax=Acinetobacter junii TaxID=40215 RepID=UPI00403D9B67